MVDEQGNLKPFIMNPIYDKIRKKLSELNPNYLDLYNKYKSEKGWETSENFQRAAKLKLAQNENIVVYEKVGGDTKFSVDLLIEMLGFQQGINNTSDDRPRLLAFDKFFEVGTEFRVKDNVIITRDKTNFGYEIVDGVVTKTINWIDID